MIHNNFISGYHNKKEWFIQHDLWHPSNAVQRMEYKCWLSTVHSTWSIATWGGHLLGQVSNKAIKLIPYSYLSIRIMWLLYLRE
jgi:hypothetical protein